MTGQKVKIRKFVLDNWPNNPVMNTCNPVGQEKVTCFTFFTCYVSLEHIDLTAFNVQVECACTNILKSTRFLSTSSSLSMCTVSLAAFNVQLC